MTNPGYARWHGREGLYQQPIARMYGTLLGCTAMATLLLQNPTKKGSSHLLLNCGILEQERGSDIDPKVHIVVRFQRGGMRQSPEGELHIQCMKINV